MAARPSRKRKDVPAADAAEHAPASKKRGSTANGDEVRQAAEVKQPAKKSAAKRGVPLLDVVDKRCAGQ